MTSADRKAKVGVEQLSIRTDFCEIGKNIKAYDITIVRVSPRTSELPVNNAHESADLGRTCSGTSWS